MRRMMVAAAAALLGACPSSAADAPANGGEQTSSLKDIGFGIGVAAIFDIGHHTRVTDAAIVNNVVRINSDNNDTIRPMLEGHILYKVHGGLYIGPFLGLQLTSGQIVDAIGAGIMFGFRNATAEKSSEKRVSSLNFGVGLSLDPNIKTLGNGFREDMPPPPGETDVRFRNRSQVGVMAMTSYGF